MKREEYLQIRRLQGINTNISRAEDQIRRGKLRMNILKSRFEGHKASHEQTIKNMEDRIEMLNSRIANLETQKSSM